MYTTSVVCLVSGMWGSMVCGVEVGMYVEGIVCGDKCYVGGSGMGGQRYVGLV